MGVLKAALIQFSEKKYSGYVFVLTCFLFLRLVAAFIFYNGFILNFPNIASFIGSEGIINSALLYVPYHSFSICLAALIHPLFLLALLLIYFPLIYKKKYRTFTNQLFSNQDKLIVFVTSFILAWELCTYDYNYFLNSAFYFDRILLLALPFLIWRFPIFTPLFIAFSYVYRSQFNYPVDGFELFDKRILFDILLMYVSLACVKVYFKKTEIPFLYMVLCIIASNYFITGVAKITISPHGYEWLFNNNISDLFLNVHARGWLCDYNEETIYKIGQFLNRNSFLLQSIILILELSGLFLLRNIKLCVALLILFCGMHFGIFLAGSMIFWKWMVIDLTMAFILWKNKKYLEDLIFSKKQFTISIVIIFTSVIWLRPYAIGWFDTKVNQYFTYQAEDESGKIAEVAKNELNPYHQWFQYDIFLFLVNKKCLPVSGFGYTSKYFIKAELDSINPERIPDFENEKGRNQFNQIRLQEFNAFIRTYFANYNAHGNSKTILSFLHPPHHLNNCVLGGGLKSLKKIKILRIIYNVSYNKDGRIIPVTKQIVDEIHI